MFVFSGQMVGNPSLTGLGKGCPSYDHDSTNFKSTYSEPFFG